mgnify:CR=1 FL=1
MKYHTTKDGKKIKLCDLELSHLENIIKMIERKSIEGLRVAYGGGSCADDFYYDEDVLRGKKAKDNLNFEDYMNELIRRKETIKP